MTELRRPAPLEKKHDRTGFDSGAPSLDSWLRQQAGQSDRANTARTWVVADVDYKVVAYLSLSQSAVDLATAPKALRAGSLQQIPVLLCGRLAVDQRYRGLGLGTRLVSLLLTKALDVNQAAACRAVVVHALDEEAKSFWQRFGFVSFTEADDERDLYLLTKDIEATLQLLLQ